MKKPTKLSDIPTETKKKSKNNVPVLAVNGGVVRQYAEASDAKEQAEATMLSTGSQLKQLALDYVLRHNVAKPATAIKSVNLIAVEDEGQDTDAINRVQFSFTKKVSSPDPDLLKGVFRSLKTKSGDDAKWSDYLEWSISAQFDTSVFLSPVTGKFSSERYDRFVAALQAVCDEFGVDMPLACTKKLVPKDDFEDRRFTDFDLDANSAILAALPNVVSLKAIRPEPAE